ncbi:MULTISPECIES: transporter substrate-binding domain-containing protein [unclassified Aureimonas]|uniref:transporter substrate-binding domain-containing protein n=1 Tax=unclassified Aureimonas TaxID=2615206 RepID=UPI0006F41F02|nr:MULTISPECIES: transporter substrate-binding domain-containing protein [unclassified Aureimonas]KQT64368.1 amino acid ABC transporter [Aureimonas sp. Leaf427]KQT81559.1 amino acid ABC transporter [Aureimonas sp. Leaf460]
MPLKTIAFALATLSALTLMAPARAAGPELLVPGKLQAATEGTFSPFSMRAPDGTLDGLEIRVMKEVARRMGVEYVPVLIKWDSLLVGLEVDQFDVISAAMDITPERQKRVTFADGWLESGGRILTPMSSPIKSVADLKGSTVGALVSSTFAKIAEEKGATVKGYKAEADAIQDLVNGNIDAVITDSIAGAWAIKEAKLPLVMTDDYVSRVQKGFAIKMGKPELTAAINKALAEMVADGTYAKLTTDLIGFDPAPKEPTRSLP